MYNYLDLSLNYAYNFLCLGQLPKRGPGDDIVVAESNTAETHSNLDPPNVSSLLELQVLDNQTSQYSTNSHSTVFAALFSASGSVCSLIITFVEAVFRVLLLLQSYLRLVFLGLTLYWQ